MKILLFIVLLISTSTFGFEISDDFEDEKRDQETEKESKQSQKTNKQDKNQLIKRQTQNNFLKRQNIEKPEFLKENEVEEEIN